MFVVHLAYPAKCTRDKIIYNLIVLCALHACGIVLKGQLQTFHTVIKSHLHLLLHLGERFRFIGELISRVADKAIYIRHS